MNSECNAPRFIFDDREDPQTVEGAGLQPSSVLLRLICIHDVWRDISCQISNNGIMFECGEGDGS